MANEIKLKRGSGSDPSASDLVVGEIAIRTDTGKLFTKKDDILIHILNHLVKSEAGQGFVYIQADRWQCSVFIL